MIVVNSDRPEQSEQSEQSEQPEQPLSQFVAIGLREQLLKRQGINLTYGSGSDWPCVGDD